MRITSGGKINLWVDFALNFLRVRIYHYNSLVLHTMAADPSPTGDSVEPVDTTAKDSGAAKAVSQSVRNIPRLISVVEIIKREYFKTLPPGPESTGLHQYNHLGFLEERELNSGYEDADEESRQRGITAALKGHNFLRQEKTPYMKITLCASTLPEVEEQTT
ncbi:uncharacterized protein FOMMEDRAFT_76695 [Fomitiporia mediterranea MF3/22]|uniref:uncharacterized protein n=1 Tax=Fomitiporia mediterranea (strain MF3/22) TaxID=694068 RepID=UPI0004408BD0|nr:uncharacterized protein FOMMEDRAFT_76695 [Fomitiporia mediterranea MF3/22]EJD06676.1 hypothetical protein FOMMEDRAFT_76695 [Fomitiporia mediterranea MF3/22]